MIILDTSAIIELFNGTQKGLKVKEILENEAAGISAITINELLVGANKKEKEIIHGFLSSLHILSFNSEAAYKSVELEEDLISKGKIIGKLDIFIASIGLVSDLKILTADKDFNNVDGLNVILV